MCVAMHPQWKCCRRFVLWPQGKQLVHPDSQQHYSAAQLGNLQFGKTCRSSRY